MTRKPGWVCGVVFIALMPGMLAAQAVQTVVLEKPVARIGVEEGDSAYLLFGARGAARQTNGNLVVMNSGTNQIRIYDARGKHVRTIGRQGSGPGEFRGLQQLGVMRGDTIVTYDVHLGRITYFAPDGTLARTLQVQPFGNGVLPRAHGFTATGRMLARTDFNRVFIKGLHRDTLTFALFDARGVPSDTLGRYPGTETYILATPNAALQREIAFGRNAYAAARGGTVVVGTSDAFRFDVFGDNGKLARQTSVAYQPRRVQRAEVEKADAEYIENAFDRVRDMIRKNIREFPHGETYPAYGDLVSGSDGTVWAQVYPTPGVKQRQWSVFAADGRKIREVKASAPIMLLDVGGDYAVGWLRDDLGVERIMVFQLPPVR